MNFKEISSRFIKSVPPELKSAEWYKKNTDELFTVGIIFTLALCSLITMLHPKRDMSEKENRALALFPKMSFSSIADGSFMKEFETYAADQFAWRDSIVSLKANSEHILGRKENNGIIFAKDDYLIVHAPQVDREVVDENMTSLSEIAKLTDCNIQLALVPTAFETLKDKLPKHAYDTRVQQIIEQARLKSQELGIGFCELSSVLAEHSSEYIYYRTDHHQTALGSYYVYSALGDSLGYRPYKHEKFVREVLSEDFFGTSWSKSSISMDKGDTIERYLMPGARASRVEYPLEGKEMLGLYSMEKLEGKDKYSVYLDGNHGLTVINTDNRSGRSIAMLKDSYSHSVIPFLVNHFETIHLIDLRYYNDDIGRYLGENGIEDILALYNAESFNTDVGLARAAELAMNSDYARPPAFGYLDERKPVGTGYFADAAFIGDSLTDGFSIYTTLPAKFFCKTSVNTQNVHSFTLDNGETIMQNVLDEDGINKYYIMLGINEIGYVTDESFYNAYRKIIREIRNENPDSMIYIQSILPVAASVEEREVGNINRVYEVNDVLCKLAEDMDCYYLDICSVLADENGYLPEGEAADGVHFSKEGNEKWENYLLNHAVSTGDEAVVETVSLYSGDGSVDVQAFADLMLGQMQFEDSLSVISDAAVRKMYNIGDGEALCGTVYASGGSTAEEFAIFETSSESAAQAIAEKMNGRIESKKVSFESYKPEEMSKLNNAAILVEGNLAMLCISNDSDKAMELMESFVE